MNATETKVKATRVNVLTDCRVVAEFRDRWAGFGRFGAERVEAQARSAESRCKEFNAFIRDHRSQDDMSLSVERITEDQCSACGGRWELDYNVEGTDGPVCACCGVEVEP